MLLTFLATRLGKFVAGGLAIVLAGLLIWAWVHSREKAAVAAHEAKVTAETLDTARRADEAAAGTTAATKNEVERENDKARDAASRSDDPLGDGLRSLRDRPPANRATTR